MNEGEAADPLGTQDYGWVVGVALNLVGNVAINFGTNLIKLGHDVDKEQATASHTVQHETSTIEGGNDASGLLPPTKGSTLFSSSLSPSSNIMSSSSRLLPITSDPQSPTTLTRSSSSSEEEEEAMQMDSPLVKARKPPQQQSSSGLCAKPLSCMSSRVDAFLSLPGATLRKVGIGVFACGSLIIFTSYSFAAQSLLAAIASVQFISNVFFGAIVLKEKVTNKVKLATAVIVGGNVLVVNFSSRQGTSYTATELIELYDMKFQMFGAVMIALVILLHAWYLYARSREKGGNPLPHSAFMVPALYSCVAAMIGTQSVVQAKCLSTLVHETMAGRNQLGNYFTWVVLCLWVMGTLFWLYRVNRALSMFDGLFIIPILQAFFVIWTIIVGGVYFKEFEAFSPGQAMGFITGVVIVIFGVFLLAPSPTSHQGSSESIGFELSETHVAVAPALNRDSARSTRPRTVESDLSGIPVITTPLDPALLQTIEFMSSDAAPNDLPGFDEQHGDIEQQGKTSPRVNRWGTRFSLRSRSTSEGT